MNINKLEEDLKNLVENFDEDSFIYDFLKLYDFPQASITRLLKGDFNLSKNPGEILWKKKLCFKVNKTEDLHELIDSLGSDKNITKHHPRFIIVTDFDEFLAVDTKNSDSLDVPFQELYKHYDFFLPWAGLEKSQLHSENPADIKAADKMGKLYDLILQDNKVSNEADRHALNVFLSRLLFCFFAEDTGIFKDDQFTNAIASHTSEDGSDLQAYLQRLFLVLNTQDTSSFPKYLQEFPYVNGGLFAHDLPVPTFNAKARKIILECGELNWKAINPDIFGSMIQAVIHEDMRGGLGMHYTSVTNIMKVIEPLFLNDLYEQFEKAGDNKTKLKALLDRIYNLKIFDPACGSGNFLIITYKELCKLEIEIFKKLYGGQMAAFRYHGQIKLTQFYGIELDDFAHETAKLSLWLAEHQMNLAFKEIFGDTKPTLPLQEGGNVVCGNAARMDWKAVCPAGGSREIYVLGNPPYLGFSMQDKEHKEDLFLNWGGTTKLDYISIWFLKAGEYIKDSTNKFAFVSTNSINQGEQVALLWPYVFKRNLEIIFGHTSFKWSNNAKSNAGVICSVIGVAVKDYVKNKFLYTNGIARSVRSITAYLTEGSIGFVEKRKFPFNISEKLVLGNMPKDGGHLILSTSEKNILVEKYPESIRYIRKYLGSSEFIRGEERWCLWIDDAEVDEACKVPEINRRLNSVVEMRSASPKKATRYFASSPHRFVEIRHQNLDSIIIPRVSSERREYIPIGFLDSDIIVSDLAYVIYGPSPYIFALISSRMHMTWVRAVAGRLKNDYRYSSALCYNTFPYPVLSSSHKTSMEEAVFDVLEAREQHPEKTMAQLYDPDKMPGSLRQAHDKIDAIVDRCYRSKPFLNDEERLDYLFTRYEALLAAEQR
nr:DNA methyltransferase [uncultured Desulfobulbus sp.]